MAPAPQWSLSEMSSVVSKYAEGNPNPDPNPDPNLNPNLNPYPNPNPNPNPNPHQVRRG